jgi:hypothetical protein
MQGKLKSDILANNQIIKSAVTLVNGFIHIKQMGSTFQNWYIYKKSDWNNIKAKRVRDGKIASSF